ncbi:hypothetical protein BGX27_004465, partial [Mortierella sp. AM989]
RAKIIEQKVASKMNRTVISGQEQLINQGNMENELDQELPAHFVGPTPVGAGVNVPATADNDNGESSSGPATTETGTPETVEEDVVEIAEITRISDSEADLLVPLANTERRIRVMFEALLDRLKQKRDRSVSESTFTANNVAPILQGTLSNTMSSTQKSQSIKADRPDIAIKIGNKEVLYGEITGPAHENSFGKNQWDLFRLARFGKSFLDAGNKFIPLLQIIYTFGSFMRLKEKTRGMYLLLEVGHFTIPTNLTEVGALQKSLPTLIA